MIIGSETGHRHDQPSFQKPLLCFDSIFSVATATTIVFNTNKAQRAIHHDV